MCNILSLCLGTVQKFLLLQFLTSDLYMGRWILVDSAHCGRDFDLGDGVDLFGQNVVPVEVPVALLEDVEEDCKGTQEAGLRLGDPRGAGWASEAGFLRRALDSSLARG